MLRLHLVAAAAATLACAPAAALPIISEVFYDATGSDDGLSFVEIHGAPGTSLEGFFLEGVNGANGSLGPTVSLSGTIPGDGLFVVADTLSDGTTLVAEADLSANFDFQNGPDSVLLRSETTVFDAVGYGLFGVGEIFAGEGSPAPDAPSGQSLARRFADVDSDDNAADFLVSLDPTPGTAPFASVPEPAAPALLATGLALLLRAARRRR